MKPLLSSSADFQSAILSTQEALKEALKSNDKVLIDTFKKRLSDFTSPGGGILSFDRGKWRIEIKSDSVGRIESWNVYDEGVLFRKIINDLNSRESISLGKVQNPAFPETQNESIENLIKSAGPQPLLGFYILRRSDGTYYAAQVAKNSPASNAGISVGNFIQKINGVSLANLPLEDVKKLLNSSNTLSIVFQDNAGNIIEKSIEKKVLKVDPSN